MNKSALILEGGGMRGTYTSGVLDYLLEKGVEFDTIYGVSAGALNGVNYKSKQIGRNLRSFTMYQNDKRYAGVRHLVKSGNWFDVDFSYNQIPNVLDKADYDTFAANPTKLYSVVTNVETGKAEYLPLVDMRQDMDALRASASLPILSQLVEYKGKKYIDGGCTDSIPLEKSITDGNRKNLVVLTQHRGYRKQPSANRYACRVMYHKYPKFVKAMDNRHNMYNHQLDYVYRMEKQGRAFVIQPDKEIHVSRLEKNPARMVELYHQGKLDARKYYDKLMAYLGK